VRVPEQVEPTFVEDLRQAQARLDSAGKLGMFAGSAKRALQLCSVDERQPSTADDIGLCLQAVALNSLRQRMITSWRNQLTRVGGGDFDPVAPEDVLGRNLDELRRALSWPSHYDQLRGDLWAAGITSPPVADVEMLGRLADVCIRACDQIHYQDVASSLQRLDRLLRGGAAAADASPLWSLFADALSHQDFAQWDRLREEVRDLLAIAPAAHRLRELRGCLLSGAPIWTTRILAYPAAAGDPADLDAAWQWSQLNSWISQAFSGPTPAQLQGRLEELSKERRRVVSELVTERAWRRLADSLGDRERQALNSYVRAVTRFGKTGGKFAQRWITEIRVALNESKDAVPVWIMTTASALSSFRPDARPPFDVLVIDEASQIGLYALPLLALAKKTIVVGDDKQTSPENVGLNRQQVFDLLDEHLAGIPKYRTLFDPDNSLYDVAFQKFPGVVMLTEHFRCLPPIIGFSNAHAYDGRIVPLRDQPPRPGWSALGAVKVQDGYRNGFVNEPEADAVVDLVAELCANPDYDGMDIGVISLLGSSHSKMIWERLYNRLGPEVMRRRRLRCGEPANFQGDERDVIIISTVVAVDPAVPSSTRVAAMTGNAAMRRINVAASRARQQMWVVHSVEPDRFPDGDLRSALIRHCRDAGATSVPSGDLLEACESQFERDMVQRIVARGYRKISVQHNVGRFRIDMVVEGPHSRLAVECDGDRWHGPDVWHRDRARQEILERANWTFERIRGSAFYRDPEVALAPLWNRLTELGIPTGDWQPDLAAQSTIREVSGRRPGEGAEPFRDGASNEPSSEESPQPSSSGPRGRSVTPAQLASQEPSSPDPYVPSGWMAAARDEETADRYSQPGPPGSGADPQAAPQEARIHGLGSKNTVPYRVWMPRTLQHPESSPRAEVIAGLADIIDVEGPMHAQRAYRLHTSAAGGARVGREMRRLFHEATEVGLRTGAFQQVDDDLVGQDEKTLYGISQPPVILRELGPRQLLEVPRSEVAALILDLGLQGQPAAVVRRPVLDALGLVRLTTRASQYIDECLSYSWRLRGSSLARVIGNSSPSM
jgi:very-short-patch-repair endonuclease